MEEGEQALTGCARQEACYFMTAGWCEISSYYLLRMRQSLKVRNCLVLNFSLTSFVL